MKYNGVMLGTDRQSEVIEAPSLEAAKAEMEKRHGPEYEGDQHRWSCGLSMESFGKSHPIE